MTGKDIRLSRISSENGRALLVAADHGLMLGPIKGAVNLEDTLTKIIKGGVNGILISPGQAARLHHLFHGKNTPGMLIRGDITWGFRSLTHPLPNQRIQQFEMISPKQAINLGASAMVVYYLLGRPDDPFNDEATNIKTISKMAIESEKVGLPFFIEPMPFGPRVTGANYNDLLSIGIKIAEEIGADAIKIPYSGDPTSFKKIVDSVNIPVYILGGPKSKTYREGCEMVEEALEVGASGTVFGRQLLQADNPTELANYMYQIIHGGKKVKDLFAQQATQPSRIKFDALNCTGCGICSTACSMKHLNAMHMDYHAINIEHSFPKKFKAHLCTLCGKCIDICPQHAISYNPTRGNIEIDPAKCNLCDGGQMQCAQICPTQVIKAPQPGVQNAPYPQTIPLACDLCGGIPECVEWCPNDALSIVPHTVKKIGGN